MDSPLGQAWTALSRYPMLLLVPIAWDGITLAVGLLLGSESLWWPGSDIQIRFSLPSALPSGRDLFEAVSIQAALGSSADMAPFALLGGLVAALLSALVAAGFLHLVNSALEGTPPTWDRFLEGVNRFGARLVLWKLLVSAVLLFVGIFAIGVPLLGLIFLLVGLVAAVAYALVPFLVVSDDLALGDAIAQAPGRLVNALGPLFQIALLSVLCAAALSLALSALNARTLLLASPLWSFCGSLCTLGVMAAIGPLRGAAA